MRSIWTTAPALFAALLLGIGIYCGYCLFDRMTASSLWIVFGAGLVVSAFSYYLARKVSIPAAILSFSIGFALGNNAIPDSLPTGLSGTYGTLTGEVVKLTRTPETMRAVTRVSTWQARGDSTVASVHFNALCVMHSYPANLCVGSRITLTGKLSGIEDTCDLPFQTDFNRFLHIDGVVGRMNVYSSQDYRVDNTDMSWYQKFCDSVQSFWLQAITDAGFDDSTTAFMLAVIGGDDLLLSDNIEQQFRDAGLAHIMAISGLHVSIVLAVILLLLWPLKLNRHLRTVYYILGAALVLIYALATGLSPSACRAALMCCVLMADRLFEVNTNPLQRLSVAVWILLCLEPLWLFMPGFQFSVSAVFALILFSPVLNLVPVSQGWKHNLWILVTIPIIAVFGTLIPTIYYFHSFAANFWLSNIMASVIVPPLIVVGFLATLLSLVGLTPGVLSWVADMLYRFLTEVTDFISGLLPTSRVTWFAGTGEYLVLAAIVVLLGVLAWNYSHRRAIVAGVICAVLLFTAVPSTEAETPATELYIPRHSGASEIIVIDNGCHYLWTSKDDSRHLPERLSYLKTNYNDFYRNRGVSDVPIILNNDTAAGNLELRADILTARNRALRIVTDKPFQSCETPTHYTYVTELYKGNMYDLVNATHTDTILLSRAIHHLRLKRFKHELDSIAAPYRLIADQPLTLIFN